LNYDEKLEAAGHVLKRDEDGDIDHWVMDVGYHNGPGCINCHDSWCQHCEDTIEPCIGKAAYDAQQKESRFALYQSLKKEFENEDVSNS
jgi:hypothetical protein